MLAFHALGAYRSGWHARYDGGLGLPLFSSVSETRALQPEQKSLFEADAIDPKSVSEDQPTDTLHQLSLLQ